MIRAVIVEDSRKARERLIRKLTKYCPEVEVVQAFESVSAAIEHVKELDPDLVFLDIEFPREEKDGFDFLEETKGMRYYTIFTSGHEHYALKAFKYSPIAVYFLHKPFPPEDLHEAISYYKQRLASAAQIDAALVLGEMSRQIIQTIQHNRTADIEDKRIGLPSHKGVTEFIPVKHIIWSQAHEGQTNIFIEKEKEPRHFPKMLKDFEDLLKEFKCEKFFFRIHRSFLINARYHLLNYSPGLRDESGFVKMSDNNVLPVAKRNKEGFESFYKQL